MIGKQVSHFYLVRRLGAGGMGVVYEAQDVRLPRSVAIKILKSTLAGDGAALRRFKREARLAASLNHPNVCTVLDVDEGEGQPFIAMELLHGCSLKDRLLGEPLSMAEVRDIGMQVCEALAAAHDQGIIHRDVKPGNVFLTESGLVKVLDFGLAKHFPANDDGEQTTDNLTAPGAVAGTLYYMAPEQLTAAAPVDFRCDLFSLGTLLYEMATGSRPFDTSPRSALSSAIQFQPHTPLRELTPACPPELERIVDTLLAKRPADRYASARATRDDLEALTVAANAPPRPRPTIRSLLPVPDDRTAALRTALADRYALGVELGRGGMATVYAAEDLRHRRRVAVKVFDPEVGARLGAQQFLAEIHLTAGLQHPNLLPLFDSGEAAGLLYYVMPLVEGASLRARLQREPPLSVNEAVRIVSAIAGALDYAHRQGVVHRDIKPENILLNEGQPLVADFGIALALTRADGPQTDATASTFGTPRYMSPEQAAGDAHVDGRSDIYSLGCVLYELLAGETPFSGSSAQEIIAKVISEPASSVRALRPTIPPHIDAALARALAKRPADRYASASEFGEALAMAPERGLRRPLQLVMGAGLIAALASAGWFAVHSRAAAADPTVISYRDLIDQTQFGGVTLTPDGRALVYTGAADAGRPVMEWPLDQRAGHAIPGTEHGMDFVVSPDGRRLAYRGLIGELKIAALSGPAPPRGSTGWRFGNGGWIGDSVVIIASGPVRGLYKIANGGATRSMITRPDTTRGEIRHLAPLVLPGNHAMVFTVAQRAGQGLVVGPLAIASLDSPASVSPHVLLAVKARRAIAFVDGWLLYTAGDGKAIMAVRLDVDNRRVVGTPVEVLKDNAGNLEMATLADNGTLLYLRRPRANSVVFTDTNGVVLPGVAHADGSFMNPRLSPDGKLFLVQASSAKGEDVWLYDVAMRKKPVQLTTSGRALQPAWSPDGRRFVYLFGGSPGAVVVSQPIDPAAEGDTIRGTESAFAAMVGPDGKALVFHRRSAGGGTIWSAPMSGEGEPRNLLRDRFNNTMPALSRDGRWMAYASNASGSSEVYVRSLEDSSRVVQVSDGGGTEPAWSSDGRQIYYRGNGMFMAASVTTPDLAVTARRARFKDVSDNTMPHRNYDVSPDGKGFLMIAPSIDAGPEAVVWLYWLIKLRERLALER